MEDNFEVSYTKLRLKKDDILIINVSGDSDNIVDKMSAVRNDDFVKFIEDKGHSVLVINNTIKMELLRKDKDDKVVVYAEVGEMSDSEIDSYINIIKERIETCIKDPIIIPCKNNVSMKVMYSNEKGE